VCVCILFVYIYMMYVLYEYTGKQRPTFSSVRKVTLNGCYGINTNDNNNGAYPPATGACIYIRIRPLHHVNPDHRFPLLFILFLLLSEPFPSTFITVLLYIHFLYIYKPYIIYYYYSLSHIYIYSRSYARKPISTTGRDEYIRYIIVISPPSTSKFARTLSGFRGILWPLPDRSPPSRTIN